MKKLVFLITCFCVCANSYAQETRYIRDTLYITLRSEPSSQSEAVFRGLVSGSAVTLIELTDDDGYSLVRTVDGVEGWVQSQYLVEEPTANVQLQSANQQLTELNLERAQLQEQLSKLESEYRLSQEKLETLSEQSTQQEEELLAIKSISSNAIELDSANAGLQRLNGELKGQLQDIRNENKELQDKIDNNKFLHGAYAVLIGVFITLLIPRLRRSRSKEWA